MPRPRSFYPLPFLGLVGFLAHGTHSAAALRDLCPAACMESGPEPSNWTVVAEVGQLQACARLLLLGFSLTVPVTSKQHIRTCNVWANDFDYIALQGGQMDIRRANLIRIPVCGPEEAKKNLEKGRKSYGDSPNFPCDA